MHEAPLVTGYFPVVQLEHTTAVLGLLHTSQLAIALTQVEHTSGPVPL